MKKILVVHGASYGRAITGLGELVNDPTDIFHNPEDYSLVLFTGGEDVSPSLYDDTSPKGLCGNNIHRDVFEKKILTQAQSYGIPCAGICRGVQFLNVMSGGRMMHHIDGHGGTMHAVVNTIGEPIIVNSYHHQMILPPPDAVTVAVSETRQSGIYIGHNDEPIEYTGNETEAAIFPASKCFGAQWHPEMMKPESDCHAFFFNMVKDALTMEWEHFVKTYDGGLKHDVLRPDERDVAVRHFAG